LTIQSVHSILLFPIPHFTFRIPHSTIPHFTNDLFKIGYFWYFYDNFGKCAPILIFLTIEFVDELQKKLK